MHKTRQNKERSHTKRTKDLWNTRCKIQIQTKLDQPSRKNGQHQNPETHPRLQNREGEENVGSSGKDGNALMQKQVKRPNPWRKMMMMTIMIFHTLNFI